MKLKEKEVVELVFTFDTQQEFIDFQEYLKGNNGTDYYVIPAMQTNRMWIYASRKRADIFKAFVRNYKTKSIS